MINFSLGVCSYVEEAVACGGDVIGLDWHLPLRTSWSRIGHDRPVQGNLDPMALLARWPELKVRVDQVLDDAAGRPGHIFNVGHGVPPDHAGRERPQARRVRRRTHVAASRCGMTVASISTPAAVLPIGVLIMAYGGPSSLAEMPGYLADIRSGRPTSREVLEEISHNYEVIGGCSPLPEISRRQVDAVQAQLDPALYRCYLGMRHWAPWIEEVVGEMLDDGITHAISVVLAPHYSALSIAKYGGQDQRGTGSVPR